MNMACICPYSPLCCTVYGAAHSTLLHHIRRRASIVSCPGNSSLKVVEFDSLMPAPGVLAMSETGYPMHTLFFYLRRALTTSGGEREVGLP